MTNKQSSKIDRILKLFNAKNFRITEWPGFPEAQLEVTVAGVLLTLKIDEKGEVIEDN
tara:strand:+ start:1160 stop:1333 length:174 start_codon:yes stop_codon:yes gene_type:complete